MPDSQTASMEPDYPAFEAWQSLLTTWVAAAPAADNPAGLQAVRRDVQGRLQDLGFSVALHDAPDAQPVLIAARAPGREAHPGRTVGLFAHYDVEAPGSGWEGSPSAVALRGDRIYGRGVADNLGPLALRLLALTRADGDALPGLLWVIQGEEEIGSPFAHRLFPTLRLPEVDLWLEETGYFEQGGAQRVLWRRAPPALSGVLRGLKELAARAGRELQVYDRYLNKAFGEARCPCLSHLVGDRPYLAIGPNDTSSRIHAANESLPRGTLALSQAQLLRTLYEVAAC